MRVCALVSEQMEDEAPELSVDRQMAEFIVENWDGDEPDRAWRLCERACEALVRWARCSSERRSRWRPRFSARVNQRSARGNFSSW